MSWWRLAQAHKLTTPFFLPLVDSLVDHGSVVYVTDTEGIMTRVLEEEGAGKGGSWTSMWLYPAAWRIHNLNQFALLDDRWIVCQFAQRVVYILDAEQRKVVAECSLPAVLRVTDNLLWCSDGTRVRFEENDAKPRLASPWIKEVGVVHFYALLDAGNNLLLALGTEMWFLLRNSDLSICCKGHNHSPPDTSTHRIIFHDSSFLHLVNGKRLLYYT